MATSLTDLVKKRYLDVIRGAQARWKTVVIDSAVHSLWNGVLAHAEILAEGVQSVEFIERERSASSVPVVYILAPTSNNVQRILADFQPPTAVPPNAKGRKAPAPVLPPPQPKYAAAHVHFIEALDDRYAQRLMQGLPPDYLKALTELFVNFFPLESRVFSLKTPDVFPLLYRPPGHGAEHALQSWEEEVAWTSRAIVNVLATLGEYPYIRYYRRDPLGPGQVAGMSLPQRLAERVQRDIDQYARDNDDFPPAEERRRSRGVLLITDRSMDISAPFLHEFTYQAMCHDLLPVTSDGRYQYSFRNAAGESENREAKLSEEDQVWTELRHMHMKDALEKLVADFKQYASTHGTTFHPNTNGTSINDMKDMLASLPQLREAKDQLSLHLDIATKCMTIFEKQKLPLSASVEQCCATGCDAEGKTPKTLVEEMVPLLDDRSLSALDKVRIIALYIIYRDGVAVDDKKRLFQHARLAFHEMDAVNNLRHLGLNVDKDSGRKRKPLFKHSEEEDSYQISRYQPSVKYMLEAQISGKLDDSLFPYTKDAPEQPAKKNATGLSSLSLTSSTSSPMTTSGSLRSARPQWGAGRTKITNDVQQRVIVFVAGGMTFSEIRSTYQVSQKTGKDIVIGSHDVFTPERFIRELTKLGHGESNGLLAEAPSNKRQQNQRTQQIPLPMHDVIEKRFSQNAIHHAPAAEQPRQPSQQPRPAGNAQRPSNPPAALRKAPDSAHRGPPAGAPVQQSYRDGPPPRIQATNSGLASSQSGEKKKRRLFGF